jgi:hypothetical protein
MGVNYGIAAITERDAILRLSALCWRRILATTIITGISRALYRS